MYYMHEQDNACDFNKCELERLGLLDKPFILGLKLGLAISFPANVFCELYIQYKDEKLPFLIKARVKTPYSNKRVYVLCNNVGRKQSKAFLPVSFDSFEELQKIERVTALWTIKTKAMDGEITEYVLQDNIITGFEEKQQAGTYGVRCYDKPYLTMLCEANGSKGFLDKSLSIKDGKVHSDILLGSDYDDVYFFFLEGDTLETIALETITEYHAENSNFQLNIENDFIWGAMGFQSLKRDMMNKSMQKEIVSYYRSVIKPNDRGILM